MNIKMLVSKMIDDLKMEFELYKSSNIKYKAFSSRMIAEVGSKYQEDLAPLIELNKNRIAFAFSSNLYIYDTLVKKLESKLEDHTEQIIDLYLLNEYQFATLSSRFISTLYIFLLKVIKN